MDWKIFEVDFLQGCPNFCFFFVSPICFVLGHGVMHVVISLRLVKHPVLFPLLPLGQKAALFSVRHEVLPVGVGRRSLFVVDFG